MGAPPGGGDPLVTGSSPTPAAAFLLAAAQAMPSDPSLVVTGTWLDYDFPYIGRLECHPPK